MANHSIKIEESGGDLDGRLASATISYQGSFLQVTSTYAPNVPTERKVFYEEKVAQFLSLRYPNVLAGDFNCVQDLRLEHKPLDMSSTTRIGFQQLADLTSAFDLVDLWRAQNSQLFITT